MNVKKDSLRDFVQLPDGRIAIVVANDSCGGVFRGHYDLWFGEVKDGVPVVEQHLGTKDWVVIRRPIGALKPQEKP